jgi:hypothetical protein
MIEKTFCKKCGSGVEIEIPYIRWDKPRRFVMKLYGNRNAKNQGFGEHQTLGIVAYDIGSVAKAAQEKYPMLRIESIVDTGAVDLVLDFPTVG